MKGCFSCITAFHKFIIIQRYLVEEICQEVLTLHLLTITLRRKLNPPGFFQILLKGYNRFQFVRQNEDFVCNSFVKPILLINLLLLRLFNNCYIEGYVRNQKQLCRA